MELHLKIIGWLFIALACIHVIFPKYFNWKDELKPLSPINRQMMEVHTFFIAVVVLGMGLLNLFCSRDLLTTPFGKVIGFGLFVFWLLRLIFQFFVYSSLLWKGKKFETTVHIFFSIVWCYCVGVYFLVWFQ